MKRTHLILLALLLFVSSCATARRVSAAATFNLEGSAWQVAQLNGRDITPHEDRFTLSFLPDNRISGRGTCNVMMGSYAQAGSGQLTISSLASTRSACPDMALEAEYMRALESITAYQIIDGSLLLLAGEQVAAKFESKTSQE